MFPIKELACAMATPTVAALGHLRKLFGFMKNGRHRCTFACANAWTGKIFLRRNFHLGVGKLYRR
jgi:hypothetical protein